MADDGVAQGLMNRKLSSLLDDMTSGVSAVREIIKSLLDKYVDDSFFTHLF